MVNRFLTLARSVCHKLVESGLKCSSFIKQTRMILYFEYIGNIN